MAFKNLNVCVDQATCTCAWFARATRERYAMVDGCLDMDLKSIFCGVVIDTVQVPRVVFNPRISSVLRIMVMVRQEARRVMRSLSWGFAKH